MRIQCLPIRTDAAGDATPGGGCDLADHLFLLCPALQDAAAARSLASGAATIRAS